MDLPPDTTFPKTSLLEHGYCQLIEPWGSDRRIIESARQSTDKGFLGWGDKDTPGDEKLLAYLWKNQHSTPFEFGGLTIEVQAPIFVFREWHRHRVPFGYSELSARYAPMPALHYTPTLERLFMGGGHLNKNKQASIGEGALDLTEEAALDWLTHLELHYQREEALYKYGLRIGIPKELARIPVSVARFSRKRATGNLRGWLGFIKLRAHPTAQWEIRVFAEQVAQLIVQCFPRTAEVVALTALEVAA